MAWTHPSYRTRYLPALTASAIAALPKKARALVIVPTGAIEQHGPHLPVGGDAVMGQAWLNAALPLLPAEAPVYVAPPITLGKSNEHVGYPGTLIVQKQTLRRLLLAIIDQCWRWGFRRFGILNTHGGNSAVIVETLRELQGQREAIRVQMLSSGWYPPVSKQETVYGFHAGEVETAWVMAVAPEQVDASVLPCEFAGDVEDPAKLRAEFAPATYSWVTSDISNSGVMGDASQATPEKGREWLARGAEGLAANILRFLNEE
ncbi:MAG: creatininase family protein [Opitutales bacterium]